MSNLSGRRLVIILLLFIVVLTGLYRIIESRYFESVNIIQPLSEFDSIFFEGKDQFTGINDATRLGNLPELRKMHLRRDDLEIRVWRAPAFSPLEGVILNRTDGKWLALHIKNDRKYPHETANVNHLYHPRSGWNDFWKILDEKEILTIPQLPINECRAQGVDGVVYAVEVNQGMNYRNYIYPAAAECREAQQTSSIGEIIGLEFDSGQEECKNNEWFACMTFWKSRNLLSN